MNEWVPLFQELVWPIFAAVALLCARAPLSRLLKAFEDRIVAGAEFEAGATGIKVGAAPKLSEVPSPPANLEAAAKERSNAAQRPGELYLVHTARRDRSLDQGELRYYRVRIYLDANDPTVLDDVSEVTYYLHESFRQPVRIVRDRQTSFELRTEVWGEFNVAAAVGFRNGREVKLERYLNL
jgi:hypothetical protein